MEKSVEVIQKEVENIEGTGNLAVDVAIGVRENLEKGLVWVMLGGELGAGKTEFVRHLLENFSILEVSSPSFVLEHEYKLGAKNKVYHLDLWRLENASDLEVFGYEKRLKPGDLILVEWASKFEKELQQLQAKLNFPQKQINVEIKLSESSLTARHISISEKNIK